MSKIIQSMALLILSSCSLWVTAAGVSPVTLSFQNGTTSFATGATGSANYLVSMDASTPPGLSLSLSRSDYSWVTQVTTGTSACTSPAAPICATNFTPSPGGSCCLMLSLNGASVAAGSYALAPVVASTPATYQYTVASPTTVTVTAAPAATLTQSVSTLALSVNDTATNAALTGNSRQVTITNSSTTTATSVAFSYSTLPTGTTITSNATPNTACGNIAPSGSCILNIYPGATPSATAYDLNPTAITLTTAGSNTNTLTLPVSILTYGSVYQSGYVYSIDDDYATAPISGSVGGKVAALTNQAAASPSGIAWDADPACATSRCTLQTNAWDFYYGQDLVVVPGSTNPGGAGDNGPGDTYQIFSVLNGSNGNTNNPANYAASLCTTYAEGGYTNWYLPAICEMGPASNGSSCTGFQNMVSNLSALLGSTVPCTTPAGCLAGFYWSSTEYSGLPQDFAWDQYFRASGSLQTIDFKYYLLGVRCSRALTI